MKLGCERVEEVQVKEAHIISYGLPYVFDDVKLHSQDGSIANFPEPYVYLL
jgi:hypothetical protein